MSKKGKRQLSPDQAEAANRSRNWPKTASQVAPNKRYDYGGLDPVVLGVRPAPIDNDVLADACILLAVIAKTKPEKVAEFFRLTGSKLDKMTFLLHHGGGSPESRRSQ